MLNFRNTNIFFVLLLAAMITLHVIYGLPWYSYLFLLIAWSLVVFYGCYYIGSGFFIKVYCSADTGRKEIAISFDDGPQPQFTPAILKTLKQEDVKAAFFCIGKNIPGNERILKQVVEEGHIVGNHSYTHHTWFDLFSSKQMLGEMKMMDNEMKRVTGLQPKLFRPPYGVINPSLKKAIVDGGYTTVGWSVRSMDTVVKDEKKLLNRMTASIKPGAVFLFHDAGWVTAGMLPAFIKEVKNRGYRIVPLDKLLALSPYV